MGKVRLSFRFWFGRFHRQLETNPLRTQMVMGGTLTVFGDVIAQQFCEGKKLKDHDWIRSARMGFFAIVVWSYVGHKW
jgi:hypothetical protein